MISPMKKATFYIYLVLLATYITWGTLNGQGAPGYLMGWMMDRFGWASTKLVVVSLALVGILPALPLLRGLPKQQHRSGKIPLLGFLLLIITPTLLGWWGRDHLKQKDQKEQALVLQQRDLTDQNTKLEARTHLLRISGFVRQDAVQVVETEGYGKETAYYVPFTAQADSKEIEFVVVLESRGEHLMAVPTAGGQGFITLRGEAAVPAQLDVVAEPKSVPVFVTQGWESNGFQVAEQLFCLEPQLLVNDRLPSNAAYIQADLALYLGLGASFILLIAIPVIGLAMRIREQR